MTPLRQRMIEICSCAISRVRPNKLSPSRGSSGQLLQLSPEHWIWRIFANTSSICE